MRRHIEFERLHNFRDLGGYPAADGRKVAWRRLYRSDSLGRLAGQDWDTYRSLGVRTVIDLRYPYEVADHGRVPHYDGLRYHNVSIEHRPYDQAGLGPQVQPGPFLAERYAEVAEDGVAEISQVVRTLARAEMPIVVHCASGKDRTGLVVAVLLTLLGVGEDHVVADFALTERARAKLVADWIAEHPDRTLRWPGFGHTPPEIMRLFLDGLRRRYGSVRGYAEERLGVDENLVGLLRQRFLALDGWIHSG